MTKPEAQFIHERDVAFHASAEVEAVVAARREAGEHLINSLQENGEPIPKRPDALGDVAVAATVELPKTPEVGVEQLESERKKNTAENLRGLKNRFGERFVKGDLMEGGGYTGGAARELLAGFMDRSGFVTELKRLIPAKQGALRLLKDNQAYIQATLDQRYKDDPGHEHQPAKDPYELARSVGYELTGPFASTSEFVPLDKQDFRPSERLCTFNNPIGRLRDYNVLWLRHTEVGSTLPADELTADTLSEGWKTYLKTIGRYDRDSDSYNLDGLRPARDDPYGISSMSVQISRKGTHVSVKNRYNHTVGNPDNTLDSDLDNVAYGLKRAVYSRVGREDLMNQASVTLAEGYIGDNGGGIHSYVYEEDNVYYGDYEYIENGVVTAIDRGKYYMISPQLYVPKSGKGDEIRLGQRSAGITGLEVCSDVRFLYENNTGSNEKDQRIAELRQMYAERDHAELKASAIEYVREQIVSASAGYKDVMRQLNGDERTFFKKKAEKVLDEAELNRLFAAKDKEWQEAGVYDYAVEQLVKHGIRHNLAVTPNINVDGKQLTALAQSFGKDQPYETYVYKDMYHGDHYSAQELSGAAGDEPVRFSLIPAGSNPEFTGTVEKQLATLHAKNTSPAERFAFHVPSVLEAITNWYALRARGDKLADSSAFDKTYIRHFNLPAINIDGWSCVPYSYVGGAGGPYLYDSDAEYENDGCVAVG